MKILKTPLIKMIRYDFSGIELSGVYQVKVFRCKKYTPYSSVDSSCLHDEMNKEGFINCEEKRRILQEVQIPELFCACKCYLYRPYYWYVKKLFEAGEHRKTSEGGAKWRKNKHSLDKEKRGKR